MTSLTSTQGDMPSGRDRFAPDAATGRVSASDALEPRTASTAARAAVVISCIADPTCFTRCPSVAAATPEAFPQRYASAATVLASSASVPARAAS
jgi:hypothetical protein